MCRTLRFLAIVVLMMAAPLTVNAVTIQEVVNQISQTSFHDYMNNTMPTHLGQNRAIDVGTLNNVKVHGAQHDMAADAIFLAFRRSGWTTRYDPFAITDTSGVLWNGRNVIAVKQGTTHPDDIYLVCGHYDSTANHETTWTTAPGGDDNASGIAGILEMARVFSKYTFDSTIVFAAFDGEETTATTSTVVYRRIGSIKYTLDHQTDSIKAMIALDMMSWSDGSGKGRLETGYSQNTTLNAQVSNALATYGGLGSVQNNSMNYGDHVSFGARGIPAIMLIENNWSSNPNYHTQTDSTDMPNYIDYAYGTKVVKATAGWLCEVAGLNGLNQN